MTVEEGPVRPRILRLGRPWAVEKLELLRYYLGGTSARGGGFMVATKRAPARYYIDLFAGPGQSRLEDGQTLDGSPLIAAKATPSFDRLYWVEANARNVASLRAHRLDFPSRRIDVVHSDANSAVDAILAHLPRNAPTLAFLDPEGAELAWSTVEKLARHGPGYKIELFMLFAYNMGIVRLMPRDRRKMIYQEKLDQLMPDARGWRDVYSQRDELSPFDFRRAILEEYVSGLKRLGYRHIPAPRLIPAPVVRGCT